MTINVTENNIKKGQVKRTCSCPIALALKDAGFLEPKVGYCSFIAQGYHRSILPYKAQLFIANFDSGAKVKPFSFEFDPKPFGADLSQE